MSVLSKIMRAGEGKILRKLHRIADQVNSIEEDFEGLSDAELRALTDEYKQRYADGESLDDLLPEAFATVREAARRVLGQRHYDVQIMGGAALHMGYVAEMKTGEGKTLVGTLPAYLNALSGEGVHIITVNDYLAERDSEMMGRVHRFLGLSVGCILANMTPAQRREQYACDITYGTNNEFGFDYLRDNMAWSKDELVQRGHNFAIVDEVDSILIDEARTPLIISGPADQATKWYGDFAKLVKRLKRGEPGNPLKGIEETGDYDVDEKKRTVAIHESGVAKVEDWLGIDNLYESVNTPLVGYLNNAIKAKELFKKDKDYVIIDDEVMIVDEHTGRILAGRRYNEGMHQAIEAKEGVPIKDENQTLATITLQNFFRLYKRHDHNGKELPGLSGMTGTAMTEAAEFHQIYKLGVVPIPTNRPMVRKDQSDLIYRTEVAKFEAVVDDIEEKHRKGQPILVGTTSVEKSEYLSQQLSKRGIQHEVLNAKHHEREAQIVAQAGRRGAVTVATNMAGRGTDIKLGGNPEDLAEAELRQRGLDPEEHIEEWAAALPEAMARAEQAVKAEKEEVEKLGGLYVLGTERHESRRIDNQLRGRSGRQGDPGESRFYLSLGDDLMRLFKAQMVERVMSMANVPDDVPIENKMVTRAIASAQSQVETQNFETRKNVLKYDEVLNRQREVIYGERRRVLEGEDLQEQIHHFMDDTIDAYVQAETAEGFPEDWDLDRLWGAFKQLYPVSVTIEELEEAAGDRAGLTAEFISESIKDDIRAQYEAREAQLGSEIMRELERRVVLSVLDRKWREHLYEMDYLQEGIGLRAMAQKDPLVEYQREGFDMFSAMMDGIKEESVGYLFNLEVQVEQQVEEVPVEDVKPTADLEKQDAVPAQARPEIRAKGLDAPQRRSLHFSAPTVDGEGGTIEGELATDDEPVRSSADGLTRAERRKQARGGRRRKK
ncbi:preprotein translocase subunit SecA [Streptomyces cellulosae]|uniref:Protein translocase subunit SecA n=2 Tax=Streptomyces TaxID=1883 RepID=A0ABU3JGB4_9ACTN|nr:preprotein translocase subunit SecA [Streptomyces sp. McG7]MBT2908348.1 preprotein translocase subunit SecA [Streptomyces sp. McG8]MCX4477365.1 preprotein translocase subunit SecA [Streptomyces cellulosae]MDQ0488194.1 preprotein translocase subunit SecA [Streptomyces thermodiastaticus]MDT6974100.1 preprotein translocase subunit SecA [Streptomyces thermocarboxydus]MDX3418791.1 preprotein translocase subunit SecA [Streptomyces sp. MD20-1-1]MXQ56046.1 preprotein translocase subunit SecA [Stre